MGDPDQRCSSLTAELLHLKQDLRLNGDVQSSGRLVRNNQVRLVQHGHRDGNALAHPATELVRVAAQPVLGGGDADLGQGLTCALPRSAITDLVVGQHGLNHLGINPQNRIERHHRVLEDHGNAIAPQAPQLFRIHLAQVFPAVEDASADHFPRRIYQAHDGVAGHGFARPGLSDEAHDFAWLQREADAVHRRRHTRFGEKAGLEVLDLQSRDRAGGVSGITILVLDGHISVLAVGG